MFLVISTSLNSGSRSRIMAQYANRYLIDLKVDSQLIDLNDKKLPLCDGETAYQSEDVIDISKRISEARGILLAAPVYNYDFSAAAKNLLELTGKSWTQKVVGFLCAAGGHTSYMAPMQFANSLMLDFRALILPQFVYATGDKFQGDSLSDKEIENRIQNLADQLVKVSTALA